MFIPTADSEVFSTEILKLLKKRKRFYKRKASECPFIKYFLDQAALTTTAPSFKVIVHGFYTIHSLETLPDECP